jgi:glycosyltransferase involved in cell wall biosynthesis
MKIVVPFYNVEKWIETCIQSIKKQTFTNFKCILVDDISSDNSYEIAKNVIADDTRFVLVRNEEKKLALRNIYDGIQILNPDDEDIIVTIDGDDWLSRNDSLEILNKYYVEGQDTLVTYGTYIEFPSGNRPSNVSKYPEEVVKTNSFRKDIWRASHLRTFKYKIWKSINLEDLQDSSGNFYKMAWDLAFMFPMLEMAGPRAKYVREAIYCYNLVNPLNDHKVDHQLQLSLDNEIRNKKSYSRIEF